MQRARAARAAARSPSATSGANSCRQASPSSSSRRPFRRAIAEPCRPSRRPADGPRRPAVRSIASPCSASGSVRNRGESGRHGMNGRADVVYEARQRQLARTHAAADFRLAFDDQHRQPVLGQHNAGRQPIGARSRRSPRRSVSVPLRVRFRTSCLLDQKRRACDGAIMACRRLQGKEVAGINDERRMRNVGENCSLFPPCERGRTGPTIAYL